MHTSAVGIERNGREDSRALPVIRYSPLAGDIGGTHALASSQQFTRPVGLSPSVVGAYSHSMKPDRVVWEWVEDKCRESLGAKLKSDHLGG